MLVLRGKMLSKLRKVGGANMLDISPDFSVELKLNPESVVDEVMLGTKLEIKTLTRPKYKLSQLLTQSDLDAAIFKEDQSWLDDSLFGREIL